MTGITAEGAREPFRTLATLTAAYVLYELVLQDVSITNSGIQILPEEGASQDIEWLRRQPLLDELIFGGDPDPDDDDQFRMLLERIVLYGGVSRKALAHAIGYSYSAISSWYHGNKKPLPLRGLRGDIIARWRKLVLKK